MLNISLQEAQNKLPELINLVEQGEEIFILGNNKTRIKLVSFTEKTKKKSIRSTSGTCNHERRF
ncbi:MAG: hypothetical protein D0528_03810 [Methylococcales bacterium]|nr:MAG: hypothetical protein D0528_03810 [Methylococcales bacterium]